VNLEKSSFVTKKHSSEQKGSQEDNILAAKEGVV
jgi:hypothetical protein